MTMRFSPLFFIIGLLPVAAIPVCTFATEIAALPPAPEWNRERFVAQVQLIIPDKDSAYGGSGPESLERQVKRPLTVAEKSVFLRSGDGPWRLYEDDVIRFSVPV